MNIVSRPPYKYSPISVTITQDADRKTKAPGGDGGPLWLEADGTGGARHLAELR
jgi:hypothetical protein